MGYGVRAMVNVLITSASRKVSLVRAFQEALAREGGGTVIPVDTSPCAAALYESPVRFLVPPSDHPAFITSLLEICRRHSVRLVIPTRDEELPVFARHKELFAETGAVVMVASVPVIDLCQDKKSFIHFCRTEGFSVPEVYAPEQVRKFPELLPVFVRDRYGKGSSSAFKVETIEQMDNLIWRLDDPIIQEYIQEPEYTVDLFRDFDGRVISVVPRERLKVFGGESFVGRTVYSPAIIEECSRLASKLDLVGHNTIQCFYDGECVKFIEVNPRYGGGASLGFAAGAPTPDYLIRLVRGLPVPPCVGKFEHDLVMLRYTQDRFLRQEQLERGDGI